MESIDNQETKESQSISIKDLAWVCLSKWYLFVIALAITCGYAVYYLAKTPKVYSATASILVKDGAGSAPDVSVAFSDMDLFNTNVNINNEMVALKSPTIMMEVSRRLGLDANYTVKDKLSRRLLYGSTLPLAIEFVDLGDNNTAALRLQYRGDGSIAMGPFAANAAGLKDAAESDVIDVKINEVAGDTLATPVGRIVIHENEKFNKANAAVPLDIIVDRIGYAAGASHVLGTINTGLQDKYSSVINISLADVNTERAVDELKCVIDVYNENWIRDRNQISVSTSNFIDERLAVIESELGNVDTQISDFKSANQMAGGAEGEAAANLQRRNAAEDEMSGLSVRLSLARQIRDHLSNASKSFQTLPSSSALGNGNVENQILNYNQLITDRNLMVANSSEENPKVKDVDVELEQMRSMILSAVDGYIASINAEINSTRMKMSSAASRLSSNPIKTKHLLDKERQQKVKESLYLYLLQKREENELSQAFTAYNTKVVVEPMVGGLVSPNSRRVYMMAIAIGFLVPGVLIFMMEMLNSKVRGRRDLEKLTIPFVGEVPYNGKRKSRWQKLFRKKKPIDRTADIVVRKGSNNVINEAFRVIRTNLEFMVPHDLSDSRVLMLTSANPGSGKTFIALNLATVLSLKKKRVALVDLDLRKASLSGAVGASGEGLSNYLAGAASLSDIVVKDVKGNEDVDLYPVGPVPPNPAELLYSDRLKQMVDTLREEYDYVIIDCPPVEVVADAKIINKLVDLTLFVIRAEVLERSMLPEIQRFYNIGRYRNMAIILNGTIDPTSSRLNHGNRFGYGYGYGYGYVHKSDK